MAHPASSAPLVRYLCTFQGTTCLLSCCRPCCGAQGRALMPPGSPQRLSSARTPPFTPTTPAPRRGDEGGFR